MPLTSAKTFFAVGSGSIPAQLQGSDALVLSYLKTHIPTAKLPDGFEFFPRDTTLSTLVSQSPVLLIGSPRHNPIADDLQRVLDTPFQFVSLTPKLPAGQAILCIQEDSGPQYNCSIDPILGELERVAPPRLLDHEYDYGLVLVGRDESGSSRLHRIVWLAGIHRAGTLGAAKWLVDNLDNYAWDSLGNVCFLIRVSIKTSLGLEPKNASNTGQFEHLRPELISGPRQWRLRHFSPRQTGILCDLGNVLLPFNRGKFKYNLRNFFHIDLSDSSEANIERWRTELESGNISAQAFVAKLKSELGLLDTRVNLIRLAWCDIFWRNEPLIAFLEKLLSSRQDIRPIIFSNTDEIILAYALNNLGLNALFSRDHVVASCHPDVNPKGKDLSMLYKALKILRRDFGTDNFQTIHIDDVRNYVSDSQTGGPNIQGVQYQTFPKLVFDLRKYGIYLPMR